MAKYSAQLIDEYGGQDMQIVTHPCPRCKQPRSDVVEKTRALEGSPLMMLCEDCKIYFPVNAPTVEAVRQYYIARGEL